MTGSKRDYKAGRSYVTVPQMIAISDWANENYDRLVSTNMPFATAAKVAALEIGVDIPYHHFNSAIKRMEVKDWRTRGPGAHSPPAEKAPEKDTRIDIISAALLRLIEELGDDPKTKEFVELRKLCKGA